MGQTPADAPAAPPQIVPASATAPAEKNGKTAADPSPAVTTPAPPAPSEAELRARAELERGQRQYDLGRFEKAIEHYSHAYEAMPLPAFLFNIAQCHRHLGRHGQAAFFYRRYLDLAQEPANKALATDLLAEMEAKVKAQAAARRAEESARRALKERPPQVKEPAVPLHRRWYVWAAAGAVLVAGATAGIVAATQPPAPTLGTVSAR